MKIRDNADIEDVVFIQRLIHEARLIGWGGDYVEIFKFVEYVADGYGIQIEDDELEPYENL